MTFMEVVQLQKNYGQVTAKIETAALRSNRDPGEVKLVAVTKLQPMDVIQSAMNLGITCFGENYPEETLGKIQKLGRRAEDIEWHMIGHLQSRKAGIVADEFCYIHSIDSFHTAQKLNQELEKRGRRIKGLLEFNLAGEFSKSGFAAWERDVLTTSLEEIEQILLKGQIDFVGLMAMPPLSEDPEKSRSVYRRLREIQSCLRDNFPKSDWKELSMGTSFDFEVAVEEGATMVRVGQALFGPRVNAN